MNPELQVPDSHLKRRPRGISLMIKLRIAFLAVFSWALTLGLTGEVRRTRGRRREATTPPARRWPSRRVRPNVSV